MFELRCSEFELRCSDVGIPAARLRDSKNGFASLVRRATTGKSAEGIAIGPGKFLHVNQIVTAGDRGRWERGAGSGARGRGAGAGRGGGARGRGAGAGRPSITRTGENGRF
jgi:hypothetical protein